MAVQTLIKICGKFLVIISILLSSSMIIQTPVYAESEPNSVDQSNSSLSRNFFVASLQTSAKMMAASLRCPAGTAPIYSVILVHGAGSGMLCALARNEAEREFAERKQRAQMECTSGGAGNIFQDASLPESSSCECKPFTPDCSMSVTQEFLCCGPITQR